MKKLFLAMLLGLLFSSVGMAQVAPIESCTNSVTLAEQYQELNTRYFKGKLSSRVVFQWCERQLLETGGMAFTYQTAGETVEDDVYIIRVAAELKAFPTITTMTLLHEMVHVEQAYRYLPHCKKRDNGAYCVYDYHGLQFNNSMRRLALAGAFDGLW